jgi:hypothetical protein
MFCPSTSSVAQTLWKKRFPILNPFKFRKCLSQKYGSCSWFSRGLNLGDLLYVVHNKNTANTGQWKAMGCVSDSECKIYRTALCVYAENTGLEPLKVEGAVSLPALQVRIVKYSPSKHATFPLFDFNYCSKPLVVHDCSFFTRSRETRKNDDHKGAFDKTDIRVWCMATQTTMLGIWVSLLDQMYSCSRMVVRGWVENL